jgi:type I restriction enzyme M protein
LIFNRGKADNTNVLFIDSSKHYDSAKNQNKLNEKHIEHIVETYQKFNEGKLEAGIVEDKYSYVASFDEIQENDFNLNIPRYVDTFEEEAEVNIAAVQQEIDKLEDELVKVQAEMDKYLKQLNAI